MVRSGGGPFMGLSRITIVSPDKTYKMEIAICEVGNGDNVSIKCSDGVHKFFLSSIRAPRPQTSSKEDDSSVQRGRIRPLYDIPYVFEAREVLRQFVGKQVLFLGGIGCLIGLQKACTFFFRRTSLKGAVFFFGGISVVLFGFPFIGMLLEIYGMINLFSKFIPVAIKFLYGVPVIGWILWLPGINGVSLRLEVA
ncbi:golgi transport 1B [Schistosoma haematobium]|uniref:Golgi transport 1B n=1 Tax=Schistosoma haematobium TaxID=6185 RepID=A0A094ZVD0_SCHHA|nr:golgi transport 1B [Schistosoma haematobium]KAH9586854.1 golgi transport 1B [Schistosoma haematobium]